MSILEGVCFRCGSTLLPYLDSLRKVIDATARDPRADLTKRSAVLNATVVNSLVTIYPLEYFSVATRNEGMFLGKFFELSIRFHHSYAFFFFFWFAFFR